MVDNNVRFGLRCSRCGEGCGVGGSPARIGNFGGKEMGMTQIKIRERERKILQLRASYTLEEIGEMFGVTRERIRQIEARALRRIALSKRFKEDGPITVKSDIERLELPIRVDNCLRKSNINTIEDIIESGPLELLKIKSLGNKSIQEIRNEMRRCGFRVWNI